ncbi:MAG: hypothetical protein WCF26_27840 [Candidatus Sulfotelmatobacter sp.]
MKRESAQLVEQLLEYALEMHSKEMRECHGDDADHPGLAPDVCSYCKTFEGVAKLLDRDIEATVEAITRF